MSDRRRRRAVLAPQREVGLCALGRAEDVDLALGLVEVRRELVAQGLVLRHGPEELLDVRWWVEHEVGPIRDAVDEAFAPARDPLAEALIVDMVGHDGLADRPRRVRGRV